MSKVDKNNEGLLPCPFCGDAAAIKVSEGEPGEEDLHKAFCVRGYCAESPWNPVKADSIRWWNGHREEIPTDDLARLMAENERLKLALTAVADWTMHSSVNEYRKGSDDPSGYYAHAYYLMEREIGTARDKARAALKGEQK